MQGAPERSGAPCFFCGRQAGLHPRGADDRRRDRRHPGGDRHPEFHEDAREGEDLRGQGEPRRDPDHRGSVFAEYNRYVGNQPYTPDRTSNPSGRLAWVADTRFSILGYAPDGKVFFSYGLAGVDMPTDNFTAQATSDLDGDGSIRSGTSPEEKKRCTTKAPISEWAPTATLRSPVGG